jgi:hypothetical protein
MPQVRCKQNIIFANLIEYSCFKMNYNILFYYANKKKKSLELLEVHFKTVNENKIYP